MNELLEKLALAKWKEMIHTLNESNQLRLRTPQVQKVKEIPSEVKARMQNDKMKDYFGKDYKVHDYERELAGLERGSDEIVRKISPDTKIVREIEDIDDAAEAVAQKHVDVIGTHSKEEIKKDLKETMLADGSSTTYFTYGDTIRDDISYISKGNLSRDTFERDALNIDNNWNDYVNKNRSLEQRYSDAIKIRHEADELRALVKNRLNRGHMIDHETGEILSKTIYPTDTEFISGVSHSNHISPEVLFRESANVALAPKATQDVYRDLRRYNNETELVPDYGIRAVVDKKNMQKVTRAAGKDVEQALKHEAHEHDKYNRVIGKVRTRTEFVKPIPLGPVKQSSLRTRYLEKLAHI